ncbi:ADP-ribose pyrophosphatase YjhB (NUDIX family) [Haloactinopolyspora alba]|uniref:ADP-ribose pyrophosphatase YjhB (NUDIX family) n=1 Tax=Haloactinopolyspora alba TaxID=648780 RepID=A0A2P8DN62_9ACTN|nr:NUDIX domain-containing protein [Haloactinopolyspora alba]PSK98656.1 ADP-ribose pyrophosphatase YjhB (NUDIX family) [Haloactinopolyspora alba]
MSVTHHHTDGDGWVECSCGLRHWGHYGAAGLLLADPDRGVLLQHRAHWSHHGGTWGVPGGARASGETAVQAALREAAEEAAVPPDAVRPGHCWVEDHGPWSYSTVVGTATRAVDAGPSDPESLDITWVPVDEVDDRPLLPAFGALWPQIRDQLHRELVLVVDAANVVGSRPDGWWHDRRAAAARLNDALGAVGALPASALELPAAWWWPRITLVTEGAGRGVPASERVDVVEAPGSGDDTIVAVVAEAVARRPHDHVVAVTADRALRARVRSAGGSCVGPSVLRDALDR